MNGKLNIEKRKGCREREKGLVAGSQETTRKTLKGNLRS